MKRDISAMEQWEVEIALGELVGELRAVQKSVADLEAKLERERAYGKEVLAQVQASRQHLAELYSACDAPFESGAR